MLNSESSGIIACNRGQRCRRGNRGAWRRRNRIDPSFPRPRLLPSGGNGLCLVPIGRIGVLAPKGPAKSSTRIDGAVTFFACPTEFVCLVRAGVNGMPTCTPLRVSSMKVQSHCRIDYSVHRVGLNSLVWMRCATDAGMLYRVMDLRRPFLTFSTPGSSLTSCRTVSRLSFQLAARSPILKCGSNVVSVCLESVDPDLLIVILV
jgi:hypothetical protein